MLPPAFLPPDDTDALAAWLDWLDAHRLAPAAARVLADAPLPKSARTRLNAAYTGASAQWLLRKTALQSFLELASEEPAHPVILLKGAALALTLYDASAIRPMNDIDLLVSPEHLMLVVKRMRDDDYEERSLGAGGNVGYLHHFIFTDPTTGVRFELHHTLPLLPDESALTWFLDQTMHHDLAGQPFLTFTPGAQLLHLASHAVLEHGGAEGALGVWFYDIDQLIRQWGDELDWEETIARSQPLAWEAALHEAIRLARHYFDTPVPPAIQTWLQLPQTGLSGYNILRSMATPDRNSSLTILHILRGLTWRQRASQLSHMFFPSQNYMKRRYPKIPWPVAYPYRWFDAARKLFPSLIQR